MRTVIRPRKDGGYSECTSPDELVGKGRCCHILCDGHKPMKLNKIQRGMYSVEIEDHSTINIQAQKDSIIQFFNNLGKLKEEQVRKIVDFLNEEDSYEVE